MPKMSRTFTAYIEYDSETQLYVGTVPGLSGTHSPAVTLDELRDNLKQVIELILEEHDEKGEVVEIEPFVGIQQITVDV